MRSNVKTAYVKRKEWKNKKQIQAFMVVYVVAKLYHDSCI